MVLDDMQKRWLAQNARIDEVVRINKQLQLRAELAAPRSSLRWSRFGDLFEILSGVLCLLWTGAFIHAHLNELRFVLPAVALHLWVVGAVATAVVRLVRAGAIRYDAPVLEIQRRIEALRAFTMRSLRWLFVFGVAIWAVPFSIVVLRSWFGIDLYSLVSGDVLLMVFSGSVVLALAVMKICALCAARLDRSPRLQQLARALAGYNLVAAQDQLAKLAAFERE
jgi:hypothetical protein